MQLRLICANDANVLINIASLDASVRDCAPANGCASDVQKNVVRFDLGILESGVCLIVDEGYVVQEQIAPTNILASKEWPSLLFVNPRAASRSNATSNFRRLVAKTSSIPMLRDYPHLGLLVAGLHFHAKPIVLRWRFTVASNSATRLTICGSGVS